MVNHDRFSLLSIFKAAALTESAPLPYKSYSIIPFSRRFHKRGFFRASWPAGALKHPPLPVGLKDIRGVFVIYAAVVVVNFRTDKGFPRAFTTHALVFFVFLAI